MKGERDEDAGGGKGNSSRRMRSVEKKRVVRREGAG